MSQISYRPKSTAVKKFISEARKLEIFSDSQIVDIAMRFVASLPRHVIDRLYPNPEATQSEMEHIEPKRGKAM